MDVVEASVGPQTCWQRSRRRSCRRAPSTTSNPATARKAPPRLGQDNRRVLKQLLGLGEPELDALELNATIADSAPAGPCAGAAD
jgi:crotonobetainyl-CoA:carnitine CoA-transferase CaiB-like acyl-CoA transferase